MIYEGSQGSLNLYYNGLLISSFPLTKKKTFEQYKYQGDYIIIRSLKDNLNIKLQIKTYKYFCNMIYERKKNKQAIRRSDHELFISSLFALLKLKVIENDSDNGYLTMSRKKPTKFKTTVLK